MMDMLVDPRSDNLLMIAARDPVPGMTKTRLGAAIGMERAATLYRAFLQDLAALLTPSATGPVAYDLAWTFSPPESDFRAVLAEVTGVAPDHVWYVAQDGDDWGTRQSNLLQWGAMSGYPHTVLIASDSPHLERAVIDDAFVALKSNDVTIGRVHDGGYYLIGMSGHRELLSGVPMSTKSAADDVVARAHELGLSVAELPATFDVDEREDLGRLVAVLAPEGEASPATWAALAKLDLLSEGRQHSLLDSAEVSSVGETSGGVIGRYEYIRYEDPAAAFHPYDPRYPEVAQRVAVLIRDRMPDALVEHVGSTAVPGCAGKGVVDLMLLYPPGRLAAARDAVDGMGFQRHVAPGAFPEERPVRIGTIEHDGETFRLHVHVIAAGSLEVAEQRRFRDRLRADPTLVADYVARKRAVLADGVTEGGGYNRGKQAFIQGVLGDAAAADKEST